MNDLREDYMEEDELVALRELASHAFWLWFALAFPWAVMGMLRRQEALAQQCRRQSGSDAAGGASTPPDFYM